MENQEYLSNILTTALDHAYEGVVVVNEKAEIIHFNEAYCRLKGIKKEAAIGRHVADVIENTKLHHILKTGVPERGVLQRIAGQDMVVHRIPVWQDGKVVAAIGMLVFEGISELYQILEKVEEHHEGEEGSRKLFPVQKERKGTNFHFDEIIGRSETILKTKRTARKAAKTLATVLITGESGTGKELFAQAIHSHSPFYKGNFISINCAAIPEQLLESELFGYEEGAFTGARKGGKPGYLELAKDGTLFLDEIGDMPLNMQSKLLRVLEEKEARRVGGVTPYTTNARIIAATNKNLMEMVNEKQFREDLYYRLNIIPLHIPPLRARKGDIPLLLGMLMEKICQKYQTPKKNFTSEVISKLIQYDWPGNVREMANLVEQVVSIVDNEFISLSDLPEGMLYGSEASLMGEKQISHPTISYMKASRNADERTLIIQVLKDVHGNKTKAAKLLGIHRSTLYEKLKRLGIE